MKKILLAVTAALAITGCSQNEEFENAAQKAEINIGTIVKGTSRVHRCEVSKCSVNAQIKGKTFGFATIKYYLCC